MSKPGITKSGGGKRGRLADVSSSSAAKHAKQTSMKKPLKVNLEENFDPLFWGPYLAERQWGTVREDYSEDGSNWDYSTHSESVKQAYAWGEDGLLGISDKFGMLCASLALWNHNDPILKERLFGLSGNEGNHGEDVKELYYYVDNTPTHSYMRAIYKYPQNEFPYKKLINHGLSTQQTELEILDTGIFDMEDYWDVEVEYAKPAANSVICCVTVTNCQPCSGTATIDIIPQFCFRNTWSEPNSSERSNIPPVFQAVGKKEVDAVYDHGIFRINFHHENNVTLKSLLFTNNNSADTKHDFGQNIDEEGVPSATNKDAKGTKDAFHRYIINGEKGSVCSEDSGTKCCAWMSVELPRNASTKIYWQIFPADSVGEPSITKLNQILTNNKLEAAKFYQTVIPKSVSQEEANICRQAIAGLLWSKQYYTYNMELKLKEMCHIHSHNKDYMKTARGKKDQPWTSLKCHDILLMPDKWEFPWFAAWDLAFHCVQYCRLDMQFAKEQILILLSDRYMQSNGQIPGCEFEFGDPNPPLMAWAVWSIYSREGSKDTSFLKTAFHRLIFSFQWWSKMDPTSCFLYGNGFMGLDNISVFDRSKLPKDAAFLKQADCTGWMGKFCLAMVQISLELCARDKTYSDMCIKFFKQFLKIAKAINETVEKGGLWHSKDQFFYDVLHYQNGDKAAIEARSWTGIIPLLACDSINLKHAPNVKRFLLKCDSSFAPYVCKLGDDDFFLTLVSYTKLKSMLSIIFSKDEFLSPFGIRSLSKVYLDEPYRFTVDDSTHTLTYAPGESDSRMFGGNSNWRGPIWLCMNFLFVECLEKYSDLDRVFTTPLSIPYPSGTTSRSTFLEIAQDICDRIAEIFLPGKWGNRPVHGNQMIYINNPKFNPLVLFYEYFHAETGRGCGASHQTGWSSLVLEFISKSHHYRSQSGRSQRLVQPPRAISESHWNSIIQ